MITGEESGPHNDGHGQIPKSPGTAVGYWIIDETPGFRREEGQRELDKMNESETDLASTGDGSAANSAIRAVGARDDAAYGHGRGFWDGYATTAGDMVKTGRGADTAGLDNEEKGFALVVFRRGRVDLLGGAPTVTALARWMVLCARRMVVALGDGVPGHAARTAPTSEGRRFVMRRDGFRWGSNVNNGRGVTIHGMLISHPHELHPARRRRIQGIGKRSQDTPSAQTTQDAWDEFFCRKV
ncbi:hypothetical protein DFH09DRAFT_1282644 [Mycena vulgaris]|nr:hypothetical protein DFH09DRAFT_1282644 [Mycena vulgaris]